MAVYTSLSHETVRHFTHALGVGKLLTLEGIQSGIENTNYFVTTDQCSYVLTLFERLDRDQLPFYLQLMQHLADRGISVPRPVAAPNGELLHSLGGKPATLVTRLNGRSELVPTAAHCFVMGGALARMHVAGQDFAGRQPNLRGRPWWNDSLPVLVPHISDQESALLRAELKYQNELFARGSLVALPTGPIHADLFRDNALFDGLDARGLPALGGIFDFYFAGFDALIFDLSVCLNDWCTETFTGKEDVVRAQAFLAGYQAVRPLSNLEEMLLPAMLRAASLRFWISRLRDWHAPRAATLLTPHDPKYFERVLRCRIAQAQDL